MKLSMGGGVHYEGEAPTYGQGSLLPAATVNGFSPEILSHRQTLHHNDTAFEFSQHVTAAAWVPFQVPVNMDIHTH